MRHLEVDHTGKYKPGGTVYVKKRGGILDFKKAIRQLNEFANQDGTRGDLKVRAYAKPSERLKEKRKQHQIDLKRVQAQEERSAAYHKRRAELIKRVPSG